MPDESKKIAPLFTWRTAICESNLPSTTRLVAFALSLYMNERGGSAFPGAERLANDTGLSLRAVKEHTNALYHAGYLKRLSKGGGRGHATVWQAVVPVDKSLGVGSETVHEVHGSDAAAEETVHMSAVNGAGGAPQLTMSTPSTSEGHPPPAARPFAVEFEKWWQGYPRKVQKARAHRTFIARMRQDGVNLDRLLEARDRYAVAREGWDEDKIMHASTFLADVDGPWSEWEVHEPPSLEGPSLPEPRSGASLVADPNQMRPNPEPRACPLDLCGGSGWVDNPDETKRGVVRCQCNPEKGAA